MLILLPPSEGKTAPESGEPVDLSTLSLSRLRSPRRKVLDALVTLCRPANTSLARQVLGLSVNQDDEIAGNRRLRTAAAAPAARIYTGVLYEALDLATLGPEAWERAQKSVMIFSGLWGVLRVDDHIPAYRCTIGANLPGIGPLAPYWRRILAEALPQLSDGPVLDLRSGSYAAAWTPRGDVAEQTLTVRVLHERIVDGVRKRAVVSHFNKATKGRVARDLLLSGAEPRSVAELVLTLRDLKYEVEQRPAGPGRAQAIDLVVADL